VGVLGVLGILGCPLYYDSMRQSTILTKRYIHFTSLYILVYFVSFRLNIYKHTKLYIDIIDSKVQYCTVQINRVPGTVLYILETMRNN